MRLFNKTLGYVIVTFTFCLVWFGFICPSVMTTPDNVLAAVGATLYVIGGLAIIYGSVGFWKPEIKKVQKKLQEAFHEE